MIIVDTSGLLAAIDGSQRQHAAAKQALRAARPPWLLSPFVLAELDYLLATRVGQSAERALLREVGRGVYRLEAFDASDIEAAERVIARHADLGIGLADASVVVLANRYGIHDLVTLDERHFRALRGPNGRPYRILPADDITR
ncbi:MAG: type II toxin-antitoxin system VapC family toxin [Candidatus Limnocylindria bacterium]|nr:MAG: VapC toxin family PIN domain ribonuclease [Chloroflexota bacterium]